MNSIIHMNHSEKYRADETTPPQAVRLLENDDVINAYKSKFGGKAAIELSLNFKIVDELIAEMKRQLQDDATLQARFDGLNAQLEECTDQATGMRICEEMAEIGSALSRDGEPTDNVTPPICDPYGRIKGVWREPNPISSYEETAHLARYGY